MTRHCCLVLVLGLFLGAGNAQQELDKLQGAWILKSEEQGGEKNDSAEGSLTVEGRRFSFNGGDETTKGDLKVDPSSRPKTYRRDLHRRKQQRQNIVGHLCDGREDLETVCGR